MKAAIKAAAGGLLLGLILGTVLGIWGIRGRGWDITVENPDFWKERAASEESVRREVSQGKVKAPRVETPEIEFDFGVLEKTKETAVGSHDFPVKNSGTAPLTLQKKSKSCYCTEFSIAKKTLLPGESTTVNVK